ncbi:MAG: rhomboid family intramembrane serine protease [Nitrospiraceae bacterium]
MIPLSDDNPSHSTPFVTVSAIAACTLVFLYQASLPEQTGEAFVYQYGAIPAAVTGRAGLPPELAALPGYTSLFTSMFLHGGWMHLIGNMMYLWIFGNNVEDAMGHARFAVFYLLSGVLAAYSHILTDPASTVPMVGASGAISGVLGAYLLLYPHAQVLVFIPFGFLSRTAHVPAWIVLGLWFVMQVFSGGASLGSKGGGVAFFAHIGGFVAGMALIVLFKRKDVPLFAPAHQDGFEITHHRRW